MSDSPAATGDEHVERARKLAPMIASFADQAERARQVPAAVFDALVDAGLTRMLLPRALAGLELDPVTFVRVMETIDSADASTAWCLGQISGCSMVSAYLDPEVARKIFGDRRAALVWGPGPGKAVAVEGGYRISGTWSFMSGSHHATWYGAQCQIHEEDGTPRRRADGALDGRTMLVPASCAPLKDTWDVLGLRATASDSFSVSDLFVPAEHAVLRDLLSEVRHPGLLYCYPTGSMYASGFAAVALGIARSTLDAFVTLARDKTPRGFKHVLRESAVAQSQTAQAEAWYGSARAFLFGSLEEIWQSVRHTGTLTLEQRVRIRLASTYAIQQACAVVDFAYHAAGSGAIFVENDFERRFRDIHTVTQQLQGRHSHFETVGRFLLGLDPDSAFL